MRMPTGFTEEHLDRLVATGFFTHGRGTGTNANITNFVPDRQDHIDNEMRVLGFVRVGLDVTLCQMPFAQVRSGVAGGLLQAAGDFQGCPRRARPG